jgi:hypothetical protein
MFDGMLGNASQVDAATAGKEFAQLMAGEERIEKAYQLIRDMFLFTNKRLIFVNKQGLTGSKIEYLSIPYRTISRFSIETGGTFDLDAELKIWVTGAAEPLQVQFNKKLSIYEVQSTLAAYVLR